MTATDTAGRRRRPSPTSTATATSRSAASASAATSSSPTSRWPTGSHVMSVDAFLRALQRDVAWDFFYGTVNFDGVVGTVNHYGTVDLFAGRYNDAYRKAELDHVENFDAGLIRETFKAMLDDWTNEPASTRSPARPRPASPSAQKQRLATPPRSPAAG